MNYGRPVSTTCGDDCRCRGGWLVHPAVMLVFDRDKKEYVHAGQNCVARWKSGGAGDHLAGDICGRPGEYEIVDFWLCEHHYRRLFIWYDEHAKQEAELERELNASMRQRHAAEMASFAAQGSQIVYYVRRLSDGAIKIGTTKYPVNRWPALKTAHGPIEILATHCGDGERERQMHDRFRELRIEGEWFRAEEPLIRWILTVRRKPENVRTRTPETVPLRAVRALRLPLAADPAA